MAAINLTAAEGVDEQHLKDFENRVKIVFAVMKQRYSARAMGIDESNWHRYLTGENPTTYEIIRKFDLVFQFIIPKEYQNNIAGFYPTREPDPPPFKDIDNKLAELAAAQKRIEEKIDILLQNKS